MLRDEIIVAPLPGLERRRRTARDERGAHVRLFREDPHLHTADGLGSEPAGDDKLRALCEGGGDADLEDRGCLGGEIRWFGRVRSFREEGTQQRRVQGKILLEEFTHLGRPFRRRLLPPLRDRTRHVGRGLEARRLTQKMPRPVRIAGKDVRRDVLPEIPGLRAISDRQIHTGEIAGMITLAWTDHQRDDLPGLDPDIFKRP